MKGRYDKSAAGKSAIKMPASILRAQEKEEKPEIRDGYVLFWGGWPSNWWYSPFTINGVAYNCVEQYMMAEKARLFGDEETRQKILATPYPRSQKELGREVRGYKDAKWAKARYKIVVKGATEKLRQNPSIRKLALATGDAKFVECSPEDDLWGIGLPQDHPDVTKPSKWKGKNLLGKALTEARNKLRRS